MPRPTFAVPSPLLLPLVLLAGCLALSSPAVANVAPEALFFFNVIPAGGPYCITDITDCSQMRMSTDQVGLIEFQIFIDPYSHYGEPITGLTAELDWPDNWQFVDFAVCRDGIGTIDWWGSSPHPVQLEWSCEPMHQMFLAIILVFNVQEYGRLEIRDGPSLRIGCPPDTYEVQPNPVVWGEAGTTCEYTQQPCTWPGHFYCIPGLTIDEMLLTAEAGGVAHGETHFYASHWFDQGCHGAFEVATGETWCSGHVVNGTDYWDNILMIDADATNMDPGTYETWVQVHTGSAARCLNLIFEVQQPTPVQGTTWGRLKALYR